MAGRLLLIYTFVLCRLDCQKARMLELLPDFMDGRTASVKIHTETGQIEDERTYPRSEDPRRSKG